MFSYTSPKTGIKVVESFHAFYLYLGDDSVCIGDGVDMFTDGETLQSFQVGSPEFYEALKNYVDDRQMVEAYFSEVVR